MKIYSIPVRDIEKDVERQRKYFDSQAIQDLAESIVQHGLIQPVVIRMDGARTILVCGERRLKAMELIWNTMADEEAKISCGEFIFDVGEVPCLYLGEIDPVDAYEIELEENIRRENISWQEKAQATAKLLALRNAQAEVQGESEVTHIDLARELTGIPDSTPTSTIGPATEAIREDLILARSLDDRDVARAASKQEALKVVRRKEEARRNANLARSVGSTFTSALHTLLRGDCLSVMQGLAPGTFDAIISDPPYGIDAQDFNDSGGMTGGTTGGHFYDDSHETWIKLMSGLAREAARLTKPQAHLYLFCDIDRFHALREFFSLDWQVFRTPLIWFNPGGSRAPWPDQGPQRKYQVILYAVKGKRPVTKLYGDVLTYPNDPNLGHPAQKPVLLLADLLRRSCRPGDSVLDPFVGSGSIFVAANALKIKATGIELDDGAAGLAAKRLGELK